MCRFILCALLACLPLTATAQDLSVNLEELQKRDYAGVRFENYSGPRESVETAEAIQAIGYLLAGELERGGTRGGYLLRYSVIRAVDPTRAQGLDADIFSIDREARVDHIDNVRRILAGYLESAWDFSAADARLLAVFITLYNAVHRGDLEYIGDRYKPGVLAHLGRENAGISTRWSEWPGATRMLIPLSYRGPSTSELSEPRVIEEMRKQPDKGLEVRKEMVELKEREVQQEAAELRDEQARLAERREELNRQEESLARERQALEGGRGEISGGGSAAEQREAAPGEAARAEEELRRKESGVAAERAELARAETTLASREQALAAKEREIETERRSIVADERSRPLPDSGSPGAAAASSAADRLYFLWIDGAGPDGRALRTLSILDPLSGSVQVTSPVSQITSPACLFYRDKILVAARRPLADSPARLALLHPGTLDAVAWGEQEVHPGGAVLLLGDSIYTPVFHQGGWYLGRFDERLALAARSVEPVLPESSLASFGASVYVTDAQGRVLVLDHANLARRALIPRP